MHTRLQQVSNSGPNPRAMGAQPEGVVTNPRTCPQQCPHSASRAHGSPHWPPLPPRVGTPSGTCRWCSPHPTWRGRAHWRHRTLRGSGTPPCPRCRWRPPPQSGCRSCTRCCDQWPARQWTPKQRGLKFPCNLNGAPIGDSGWALVMAEVQVSILCQRVRHGAVSVVVTSQLAVQTQAKL